MKSLFILVLLLSVGTRLAAADELPPRPSDFTASKSPGFLKDKSPDPQGGITFDELELYIIKREKLLEQVNLTKLFDEKLTPKRGKHATFEAALLAHLRELAGNHIGKIQDHFRRQLPAAQQRTTPSSALYPLSVTELGAFDGSTKRYAVALKQQSDDEASATSVKPLEEVKYAGILLRKSRDKWEDARKDAPGATFSLLDNNKKKTKTVSTEGALIYPITAGNEEWQAVPSINWKHVRIDDDPAKVAAAAAAATPATAPAGPKDGEVNELQFNFAFVVDRPISESDWWSNSRVDYTPYYLTDTDFKGRLFGFAVEWIPSIRPLVKDPVTGRNRTTFWALNHSYRGIPDTGLRYRATAVPGIDFNYLDKTSAYFGKAERGSYMRFTGRVELSIKSNNGMFELLGGYRWFSGITGPTAWSEHASVAAKWWFNDYSGISLERQKGETPVAAKEVNSLTLGFEVKY